MIITVLGFLLTGFFKGIDWIAAIHLRLEHKLKIKYKKIFSYDSSRIRGFNRLEFENPHFTDIEKAYSLKAEKLVITFSLIRLFGPAKGITAIRLSNGEFTSTLQERKSQKFSKSDLDKALHRQYRNIASRLNILLKLFPVSIELNNIIVRLNKDRNMEFFIKKSILEGNAFRTDLTLQYKRNTIHFETSGLIERQTYSAIITVKSELNINQPGCPACKIRISHLRLKLEQRPANSREFHFTVDMSGTSLNFADNMDFQASLLGELNAERFFISDKSRIKNKYLNLTFFFNHFAGKNGLVDMGLTFEACSVEDILKSFPGFCYTDLYSATFAGELSFYSRLNLRIIPPFDPDFKTTVNNTLRLDKPGNLNLGYLEFPFYHTIYEGDTKVRELHLDKTNPHFVPLEKISAYLKIVIIAAEDPHFYSHKGVDPKNIQNSFIDNLANRKLMRGASTITMLIKNLFLHKNKTIKRKVEEMLLSWLVEEQFSIKKDRILEIYLNIIEFGIGIYGISEASLFYFSKSSADLSLTESLVLAYIIPRPRYFVAALKEGSLILPENFKKHLQFATENMLSWGMITHNEVSQIGYEIKLANGLGSINFGNKTPNLHKTLLMLFKKASDLWKLRYGNLPQPVLSFTYCSIEMQEDLYKQGRETPGNIVTFSRGGQSPHNFNPSLAFDIAFRNEFGTLDWSDALFDRFAELIAVNDNKQEITWGGNFEKSRDRCHFELKDWQKYTAITDTRP